MWADAGGILIANTVAESGNSPLIGLNHQTGVQEWSTPITGTSGNVCAVTSTQILNAVNNRLATDGATSFVSQRSSWPMTFIANASSVPAETANP
jgi:hypothetical protein